MYFKLKLLYIYICLIFKEKTTVNIQPSTVNSQPSTVKRQQSTVSHQPSTAIMKQEESVLKKCLQHLQSLPEVEATVKQSQDLLEGSQNLGSFK